MPYGLADEAVPYWHKLVPMIAKRGILVETDVPALADMCLVKARLDEVERLIVNEGFTVMGARGVVRNPLTMVASEYRRAWLIYCARFALTPSDRAGITVEPPEKKTLKDMLSDGDLTFVEALETSGKFN